MTSSRFTLGSVRRRLRPCRTSFQPSAINPLVVGAENRRALDAANMHRRIVEPIGAQEPDRSAFVIRRGRPAASAREREELSIGGDSNELASAFDV
jgi:hypothetical protein